MTSAEKTTALAALTAFAAGFAPTAPIQWYITQWQNDLSGIYNGSKNHADLTSGQSFKTAPVVAFAGLPVAPVTNDEAIITDANNLTNGATVTGGGTSRALVKFNGTVWKIESPVFTVATLPASPASTDEAIVTDALNVTAGATVVGSGTYRVLVRYSGSAWKIIPTTFTVATLPATPGTNDEAIVTDATVATNGGTVVGGGSVRVLVRYDGANWKIV